MRILENKGLLLKLRNPSKVTTAIPSSRAVGDGEVLVKWGRDEARCYVISTLRMYRPPY